MFECPQEGAEESKLPDSTPVIAAGGAGGEDAPQQIVLVPSPRKKADRVACAPFQDLSKSKSIKISASSNEDRLMPLTDNSLGKDQLDVASVPRLL